MNDKIAIIPQPQSLTVAAGAPFCLHAATEISGAGSESEAAHLRERIALLTDFDLLVQPGERAGNGRNVLQCDFAAERDESQG